LATSLLLNLSTFPLVVFLYANTHIDGIADAPVVRSTTEKTPLLYTFAKVPHLCSNSPGDASMRPDTGYVRSECPWWVGAADGLKLGPSEEKAKEM
jgi:hypothetical protein